MEDSNNKNFFQSLSDPISSYIAKMEMPPDNDAPEYLLRDHLNMILTAASQLDHSEICLVGVKRWGNAFSTLINNTPQKDTNGALLRYCALFAYERTIRNGSRLTLDDQILSWFSPTNRRLSDQDWKDVTEVYPYIVREVAKGDVAKVAADINNALFDASKHVEKLQTLQLQIQKDVSSHTELFERYREHAKNLLSDYNFLGLSHAFKLQARSAKRRKLGALVSMFFLGALAITPFSLPIVYSWSELAKINGSTNWEELGRLVLGRGMYMAGSVLPVVLLVLYFFRLAHIQYKSAAAVALQFEHRYGICAFVEGYAKHKKDIGIDMEKFEALVFAGVTPDPGNVPSAFDGLEGITKVIEALKKK